MYNFLLKSDPFEQGRFDPWDMIWITGESSGQCYIVNIKALGHTFLIFFLRNFVSLKLESALTIV